MIRRFAAVITLWGALFGLMGLLHRVLTPQDQYALLALIGLAATCSFAVGSIAWAITVLEGPADKSYRGRRKT